MILLQVGINRPDGTSVSDPSEMEAALIGSPYTLDREQTVLNDGIAMIVVKTEREATRLMEGSDDPAHAGLYDLPSGCSLEVPTP